MGRSPLLRSPKKEQFQVQDTMVPQFSETSSTQGVDIVDELEGILGIEDEDDVYGHLNWESFMDWEEFPKEEEEDQKVSTTIMEFQEQMSSSTTSNCVKTEENGIWDNFDDDEDDDRKNKKKKKKMSLNLSLNYEQVMEAWSDRGSLWADDSAADLSMANAVYMGEVPEMEEEEIRATRREASVLRYKEKRQNRLFSKKIRYQVRKLNADNRPRLKGRFVKRVQTRLLK